MKKTKKSPDDSSSDEVDASASLCRHWLFFGLSHAQRWFWARVTTVSILAIRSDASRSVRRQKPPALLSELGPALAGKRVQFPAGLAPAPRRGACSPKGEHMKTALSDNPPIENQSRRNSHDDHDGGGSLINAL